MQFFNRQVIMTEKIEKVFSLNAAEQYVHYQFTLCNKKWRVWTKNVQINRNYMKKHKETRTHSSRMHTVCCSGCLSCHTPPHHTCPPAIHAPCHACSPCHALTHTFAMHAHPFTTHRPPLHHACPPCGQNSCHMLVKTLPFRNYCCGR